MTSGGAPSSLGLRHLLGTIFLAAKEAPLDLELRRRLYEYVGKYPGMHLREVARALDIHPSHAKYHLQRLEKNDLVSSRHEDGYWRFWPRVESRVGFRDRLSRQEKSIMSILRRPVPLHITLILLDRTEATHTEILQEVEVAHATLHYHLSKMESSDILQSEKVGRERFYRLRDGGQVLRLLLEYRPPNPLVRRFLDAWEQLEPESKAVQKSADKATEGDGSTTRRMGQVRVFIAPIRSSGGANPSADEDPSTGDTQSETAKLSSLPKDR
jgi:predicted transcriptional regulator